MGFYELLKKAIAAVVRKNGRQEITGENLRAVLYGIVDVLGKYGSFAGIATKETDPKEPDGRVFYFAKESGVYPNFGGVELKEGLSVIYNTGREWKVANLTEGNGAVSSVNGKTGDVVLTGADIDAQIENEEPQILDDILSSLNFQITNLQENKQDTLVSGDNIKTINGESLLGGTDIKLDGSTIQATTYTSEGELTQSINYFLEDIFHNDYDLQQNIDALAGSVYTKEETDNKIAATRFDASELYLCAVKNKNGGIVSEKFLTDVIEAVNNTSLMYLENVEPSGFKFKVVVVFAGMDETNINFNASDSKAHYRIILNRSTRKATYEVVNIPVITQELGQSTELVMSQKAVTDAVAPIADKDSTNGMARVNIPNKPTLMQSDFPTENTIYVIQYDYILGEDITIPSNCVLKFDGGSFIGGNLDFNNCEIDTFQDNIFDNITIKNNGVKELFKLNWLKMKNSDIVSMVLKFNKKVFIPRGEIFLDKEIVLTKDYLVKEIYGVERWHSVLKFNGCGGLDIKKYETYCHDFAVLGENSKGTFDGNKFINGYSGITMRSSNNDLWRLQIGGFAEGIDMSKSNNVHQSICYCNIGNCGNNGLHIGDENSNTQQNDILVMHNYINYCGYGVQDYDVLATPNCGNGIKIQCGFSVNFINNVMEYNTGCGMLFQMKEDKNAVLRGITSIGNYFEGNKYAHALLYMPQLGSQSTRLKDFVVQGSFYSDPKPIMSNAIKNRRFAIVDNLIKILNATSWYNVNIDGNDFETLFSLSYIPKNIEAASNLVIDNPYKTFDGKIYKGIVGENASIFEWRKKIYEIGLYYVRYYIKSKCSEVKRISFNQLLPIKAQTITIQPSTELKDTNIWTSNIFLAKNDNGYGSVGGYVSSGSAFKEGEFFICAEFEKATECPSYYVSGIPTDGLPIGTSIFVKGQNKSITWNGTNWQYNDGTPFSE